MIWTQLAIHLPGGRSNETQESSPVEEESANMSSARPRFLFLLFFSLLSVRFYFFDFWLVFDVVTCRSLGTADVYDVSLTLGLMDDRPLLSGATAARASSSFALGRWLRTSLMTGISDPDS